jgi:ABC-type Fe3+/spermidine/putrescine transport system ATPase subunit
MTLAVDLDATFAAEGAAPFTVDAAFEVAAGETLTVLGPSGSGKTLLLESVAGFHDHGGTVALDGRRADDRPPEDRDFGFVFQDYALFPHMTVAENAAFGLRYLDDARADGGATARSRLRGLLGARPDRTAGRDPQALLADFGIEDLADRYPPTLSGGEKQRVALARALAVDPEVLLLDEPLSSLDVPTRQSLREDLQDVLADVTAVYVTHNRTTARALSDRIAVMNDGRIVQAGSPETVFERPASPTVARFTGANCVPLSAVPALDRQGEGDWLVIRPEAVVLGDGPIRGTVERVLREDATCRVTVAVGGATVEAFTDDPPAPGESVALRFPADRRHVC